MASEREKEAQEYLQKHQILELMENLISLVLFHKPESPRHFLSQQLELVKVSRQTGARGPTLICNSDLQPVFDLLTPRGRHCSSRQYLQALRTLGVRDINECPDGVNEDRISLETFRTEATAALHRTSHTFHKPTPP